MMRYMPYSSYKDSGLRWMGEIPEHWDISKIKHHAFINNRYLNEGMHENKVINYIDIGSVNSFGEVVKIDEYILKEAPNRARRQVKKGDTIISNVRTYLNSILWIDESLDNCICSTGFTVLTPKETVYPKYLYYLMKSSIFVNEIVKRSKVVSYPSITSMDIANLECLLPSLNEQKQIVGYIDAKIKSIDELIRSKEELIKLLLEKRRVTIWEAITKGIKNDMETKESGVDWIGLTRANWQVIKLKRLTRIKRGVSLRPMHDLRYFCCSGEYAWVRISDVTNANMYLLTTEERLSDLGSSLGVRVKPGEVLLSISGTVGSTCITEIKCCIHDGIVYFPDYMGDKRYLYYIFDCGEAYKGLGNIGTQLNLNSDIVGNINIPYPSFDEQVEIADYLDEKTKEIDDLIDEIKLQINQSIEYKQGVITEAVTGKIDVRDLGVEK